MFKLSLIVSSILTVLVSAQDQQFKIQASKILQGSSNGFMTVEETYNLLQHWKDIKKDILIDRILIGKSTLGNEIYMYGITYLTKRQPSDLKRHPSILLNSLIHPQERNSITILLHSLCKLIFNPSQQEQYLLKKQIIYFVPFSNIDGTLEIQRLWSLHHTSTPQMEIRKNRNTNYKKNCSKMANNGVDINRNFDFKFSELGKRNQCHQQYPGQRPFSEAQSRNLKKAVIEYNVKLVIDFHSYGNRFVYPFAFDSTQSMLIQIPGLYQYYSQVKKVLGQLNMEMEIAYKYLGYRADGVFIDWVASQGIRSFAYEFGIDFSSARDKTALSIDRSVQPLMQMFTRNQLFIIASKFFSDQMWKVKLKSLGYGEIILKTNPNWLIRKNNENIHLNFNEQIQICLQQNPKQIYLQIIDGQSILKYRLDFQKEEEHTYLVLVMVVLLMVFLPLVAVCSFLIYRISLKKRNKNNSEYQKTSHSAEQQTIQQLQI